MKKLSLPLSLLLALSMVLGACAPAATPTAAPQPTPAVVQPSQAPEPTAVPTLAPVVEAPNAEALFSDLVAALTPEKGYGSVAAAKLNEELADQPPFVLDVREASEVEKDGFIEGAVNIPVREVLTNLDKLPAQDEPIVIYCASGHRGGMVMAALKLLGYENVRNLGGGLGAWKKAGLPVATGAPAAPTVGAAPVIEDQTLLGMLDSFLAGLPEGFFTVKTDKLAEQLADQPPVVIDVRTAKEFDEQGYIEGAINLPFNEFFARLDELPAQDEPIVVLCASGHRGSIIMMALRLMGYEDVNNLGGGLNAWKAAKLPLVGWVDWATAWGDYLSGMPAGYYTIKPADLNTALVEKPPFLLDVREAGELEKDGFIAGAVNIPVREVLANLDKLPGLDEPIVVYCASGHRGGMVMAALQLLGYTDVKNLAGGLGGWKKAELAVVTGEKPAEAAVGTAPEVDATRLRDLGGFLAALPDGFFTVKPADLNAELAGSPVPAIVDVRTAEEQATGVIAGALKINFTELSASLAQLPADKAAPIVVLCQSGHRGSIAMMYLRMTGYTNVRNLGGGMNAWVAAELPVEK
jgi:rhodanese-related sulfurtransferase